MQNEKRKRHGPKDTLEERLLSRRLITEKGCWEWQGARDRDGYGKVKYKGTLLKTHRASLHLWKGMALNDNRFGCHSCDNPSCFNPEHLRPAMPMHNSAECWAKRRHPNTRNERGEFTTPPDSNSDLPF